MVDGFMGALPESGVRQFVEKHLGAAAPVDAPVADAPEPAADETPAQTVARLREEIAAKPERTELQLDLALALLRAGDADAAATQLDALPADLATEARARRARSQLDLARALKDAPDIGALRATLAQNPADHPRATCSACACCSATTCRGPRRIPDVAAAGTRLERRPGEEAADRSVRRPR